MNFDRAIEYYEKAKDIKKLALLWNSKGMAFESLGTLHSKKNQGIQISLQERRKDGMYSGDSRDPYHGDIHALYCFDEALMHFNKAEDTDPTDIANAYHNKGYTYAKLKNYAKADACFVEALKHFEKSKDIDPTDKADTYRIQGYAIARNKYCAVNFDQTAYSSAICLLRKSTNLCPHFALAWNTEGYVHTMFENYEDARECFAKAINIDPEFAKAWRNYGYVLYCLEKKRQFDEGLDPEEIEEIYENPKEKEKLDIFIEYLNKAIELDPHDPYVWHYRAHMYFRKKEYDKAIRDFERAIEIRFSFHDAWYGKGLVFDSNEQYKEAVECFDKSIKCFDESIKWCKDIKEDEKMNPMLEECERVIEHKKLAYVYISKGTSLVTRADSLPKHKKEEARKDKETAIQSFDCAIKIFEAIQKQAGEEFETDLGMGLALYNKGYSLGDSVVDDDTIGPLQLKTQYDDTIKYLERAIAFFNKSQKNHKQEDSVNKRLCKRYVANTWRNLGFIHAKLGQIISYEGTKKDEHDKAFECFEKSTKEDSSFALGWNSRGYHIIGFLEDLEKVKGFIRKQKIDDARECFEEAIKNAKPNSKYLAYFHYNKGYALYTSGTDKYACNIDDARNDFKDAASYFETALNLDPEYADAWCNKAISLYYSESLDSVVYSEKKYDIIKFLDNSIRLYSNAEVFKNDPNFANAWCFKGKVLSSLGRYEEAIRCYDESTGLNYRFGEAWYRKGLALYSMQNYNLAIECFDRAERIARNKENKIKDIELLLIRGQSKYNAGDIHGAIEDLNSIPEDLNSIPDENLRKKTLSRKYLNQGLIYYKREELDKSKAKYEEAEKNDPELAEVYYNLAKLQSTLNENVEAKKSLDRCIEILERSPNGKEELREKAREARDKNKESRQADWYQWWLGRGKGKKIAGIVLIAALISFIVSPIIITERAIVHLMSSNSTDFTAFITGSVSAQTIAAFTLAIGALLAILLLPSLQKFKVATIELETVPVNVKGQADMISPPPKISPPKDDEMPLKITAQYFRMPLRYQMHMQVYTPIEPIPAPIKYQYILHA